MEARERRGEGEGGETNDVKEMKEDQEDQGYPLFSAIKYRLIPKSQILMFQFDVN